MTPRAGLTRKRTRIQQINETRILEAALDVFAAQGFKGSTIDQIAARAGMSKPNLLYYFRRKQDIYRAVLRHTLDDWLAPLRRLEPDGDPVEQISAYVRLKMEMSRTRPKESRLFANEMLHGAPMIGDVLEDSLKGLVDEKADVIRAWIEAGRLAPVDPYHLIFMIWAATQTYADFEAQIEAVLGHRAVTAADWQAATETALKVFVEGIRPR
jgi:TetR/AcrR family transcriptional regulator